MTSATVKYILRRIAYMLPILLGIIVLTFVLFNVAGGDPAAIKLGKQATAKSMEEFDLVRGYDRPLIFGNWGRTRAYRHEDFGEGSGPWSVHPRLSLRERALLFPENDAFDVPCGFSLLPGRYRWSLAHTIAGNGEAMLKVYNGTNVIAGLKLVSGNDRLSVLEFDVAPDCSDIRANIETGGSELSLSGISLKRKTRHFFDSQFVFYFKQILRLDFGSSHDTNQKVSRMIFDGLLPSLSLTVPMFIAGLLVSLTLSLICAFYHDTFIDRFFVVFSVVLMSVNYLVWIVLGQYVLGYKLRAFPVWGFESAAYLVLPCLIGVLSGLGGELRFYRTVMLDEMYKDYVRTAFAKGVGKTGVLFKHVLKNAMIPILTSVVMAIPFLYTGSILLETFFGIPGLGRMGINAINSSDFDVVRALVFIGGVIYLFASLLTDICYALVDPRIKLK